MAEIPLEYSPCDTTEHMLQFKRVIVPISTLQSLSNDLYYNWSSEVNFYVKVKY